MAMMKSPVKWLNREYVNAFCAGMSKEGTDEVCCGTAAPGCEAAQNVAEPPSAVTPSLMSNQKNAGS
ncbi:MAG: hypothetical protein IPK83_11355 [Planctomycetes bacterium]|nr:hypothetical protein [Planctomycetota bacterium]